jgi:hypothetical protein
MNGHGWIEEIDVLPIASELIQVVKMFPTKIDF